MTKKNDNFTYIAIVAIVAIVAVSMLLAGSNTKTSVKKPAVQQASVVSEDLVGEAASPKKWTEINNYGTKGDHCMYKNGRNGMTCECEYRFDTETWSGEKVYTSEGVPMKKGTYNSCHVTCGSWCDKKKENAPTY